MLGAGILTITACGGGDGVDMTSASTSVLSESSEVTEDSVVNALGQADSTQVEDGRSSDRASAGCDGSVQGAEVHLAPRGTAQTLDVATNGRSNFTVSYEAVPATSLLIYYDTESGTYEPLVAERLSPNADYSSWQLDLRPRRDIRQWRSARR